jgi:transcription elongation factor GreA
MDTAKPLDEARSHMACAEHAACVRQLEELRTVRDRDLPTLLSEASEFVTPDAEQIAQIHDDLQVVSAEIERLEQLLRTARLGTDDELSDIVALGRTVDVEYVRTGRVQRYVIADLPPSSGTATVSAGSPVERALMGHYAGDVVAVSMPAGYVEDLRILCVRSGGDDR